MKHIFTLLKGILFGASNLIPGMSGGTMLVITNIYEKLLDAIANIFKQFKSVFLFLLVFAIGAAIGIVSGAVAVDYIKAYLPFPTACFFAGIILGSVPMLATPILKKTNWKYIIAFILGAIVVLGLMFIGLALNNGSESNIFEASFEFKDYILLFVSGFIGCFAMLIPGVSGVLMLVVFNYYDLFINAVHNILKFANEGYINVILIILPVGLGILAGLIPASKLLSFVFKKFPIGSYFAILGFVLASIAVIFVNVNYQAENAMCLPQIIIGCVALPLGFFISYFLSKMKDRKKVQMDENEDLPEENMNDEL